MPDTAKPVVTFVYGEHWEAIYVDGTILAQGPQVAVWEPLRRLGQACGFVTQIVEPDEDWLRHQGDYPDRLEDVMPDRG